MDELRKNQEYTAEITGLTSEGQGVCRVGGRAVFVRGALPGESCRLRVLKVTNAAVWARAEEILTASPHRTASACPYFGKCGGCDLWHMDYKAELAFKLGRANDALRRIGGLDFQISEILGAEAVAGYRNKAVYAVGEGPVTGFYRERSHEVIPIGRCLIQHPSADRAAAAVRDWMAENKISAYDEAKGTGLVRHVFTRTAFSTGRSQTTIVSTGGFGDRTPKLVSALRDACPELDGVILNINKTRGNTVLAGDFHTLWGSPVLRDSLCGLDFELSPLSFYQVNPRQAERLYDRALAYASPDGAGTVLDLYCGAGTISLCLARGAKRVIGAEISEAAVENARENAKRNGIENVEFIRADAGAAAEALLERGIRPDCVVVDPPRKGLTPEVIGHVAAMGPERVVYVSCDPGTLARDLKLFHARGYAPAAGAAVDMFPRTRHVETVALITRVKE